MYINNSIKSIEHREYQTTIASSALKNSTLVVLPTGLGKTVIALLVMVERLKRKGGKVLFLAPTKPLVLQHTSFLKLHLAKDRIVWFTGEMPPKKREELWRESEIIVSTPQVIENDIISGRIDLANVSLLIFDEAHRAVGEYSYVFVAETYRKQGRDRLVLGMTASPGSETERILEVCKNLGIDNIEIRTAYDRDVRPYIHTLDMVWRRIDLPEDFKKVIDLLKESLSDRLRELKEAGILDSISRVGRRKLLDVQMVIQNGLKEGVERKERLYRLATIQNEALKIYHAIELLQTQGVEATKGYFRRLKREAESKGGSRASKRLLQDRRILDAIAYLNALDMDHPKMDHLVDVVRGQLERKPDSRIIVFTHYRDTSSKVEEVLGRCKGMKPKRFIGQSTREEERGMSQREQSEVIKKFREGIYNILIATSVAEEGIDIPSTDMVVFYEPIPSEIRTIQRRGRTARRMPGKVVILIAKNTPDEAYYWASLRKEKRMRRELENLRREIERRMGRSRDYSIPKQKKLTDFQGENGKREEDRVEREIAIIVDNREYRSRVVKRLSDLGVKVNPKQLKVGDYIVSPRIGVERKSIDDFLESMIDGKLFKQAMELRNTFARPLLIIEGENLFTRRNISESAIFGGIVSLIVDYGLPIINTKDYRETARILQLTARREQERERREIAMRGRKRAMLPHERQRFIIEGLPNVSSTLAKRLLKHFKTIRNLANATEEELFRVPGVGRVTAREILEIFTKPYLER